MADRIGVAISGGGYRAAAFGLGALLYLADAGRNQHVATISSVSGGGITNAYVSLHTDYRATDGERFRTEARALAAGIAGRPRAFSALATTALLVALAAVATTIAITAAGASAWLLLVPAAGSVATIALAPLSGDIVFGWRGAWTYLAVVTWLVAGTILLAPEGWWIAAPVVALAATLTLRGPVVGRALDRVLEHGNRRARLGDLDPELASVFCATELHGGQHCYFARDFVWCHDFGLGRRDDLPVHTAVQASANLPGAFPTRWLARRPFHFAGGSHAPSFLALTDGGVYDNMADQWIVGLRSRRARLARVATGAPDPGTAQHAATLAASWSDHDLLVVVNASAALDFRSVRASAIPVVGEIAALLNVKDVLYDNGTSVRRQGLIDRFDRDDPPGTLVHIATDPRKLPEALGGATEDPRPGVDPAMQQRATAALKALAQRGEDWHAIAETATAVGTKLSPLGLPATRALVAHGYVQAMTHLHVLHDFPLVSQPSVLV